VCVRAYKSVRYESGQSYRLYNCAILKREREQTGVCDPHLRTTMWQGGGGLEVGGPGASASEISSEYIVPCTRSFAEFYF
jgi:hypothetical protein